MIQLTQLANFTFGGQPPRPVTRAHHTMIAVTAILGALLLAALWGLAVGSSSASLALADVFKVPLVILLSALTALPVGLVALRLTTAEVRGYELAGAFASSIFGGALILATLAPLVAIYYHTSSRAGVPLALGSVFVALGVASLLFVRAVGRTVVGRPGRKATLFGAAVLVVVFVAALLQFVALAAPIIGVGTHFDGGFDAVFGG
jgi:hypothetical protein